MEAEEIPGTQPREGQRPPQRMKVVQYLGPATDAPRGTAAAPTSYAAAGAAASAAADGTDPEMEAQLMILAASAVDNGAFMKGVLAKPDLRAYIMAQKLSSELTKGTLYARLTS